MRNGVIDHECNNDSKRQGRASLQYGLSPGSFSRKSLTFGQKLHF